jgi:hypothetical protein
MILDLAFVRSIMLTENNLLFNDDKTRHKKNEEKLNWNNKKNIKQEA